MKCIKKSAFFGSDRILKRCFCLFLSIMIFSSSIYVYAAEETHSGGSFEGEGSSGHGRCSSFADIDSSPELQSQYEQITGKTYGPDSWVDVVGNFVLLVSSEFGAFLNGDYSQALNNAIDFSSWYNHCYVYEDGYYGFDAELQQAIFDAFKTYAATQLNATFYIPAYTVQQAFDYRFPYENGHNFDHSGSDTINQSALGKLQINIKGYGYDSVIYTPFDFIVDAGSNQYGKKLHVYAYSKSFSYCAITDKPYNRFSISASNYLLLQDEAFYRIYGDPCFVFNSLDDAVNYISGQSPVFFDTSWKPSGTVYVTNDGLNYDWAAQSSLNYSAIKKGIEDGLISGTAGINSEIQRMAVELSGIKDTVTDIQDDTSDMLGVLNSINKTVKSIKNWVVADTLIDFSQLVVDVTDLLNDDFDAPALNDKVAPLVTTMKKKFPLSLPWDFYYLFAMFSHTPEAPRFPWLFEFTSGGEVIYSDLYYIDFSDMQLLSQISRTLLTVVFLVALYHLTIKLMSHGGSN